MEGYDLFNTILAQLFAPPRDQHSCRVNIQAILLSGAILKEVLHLRTRDNTLWPLKNLPSQRCLKKLATVLELLENGGWVILVPKVIPIFRGLINSMVITDRGWHTIIILPIFGTIRLKKIFKETMVIRRKHMRQN